MNETIEFINKQNEGGGNCLFLSLGYFLKKNYGDLRQESVDYIKDNALSNVFFKDNGFFNEELLHEFCADKDNINTNKIKKSIKQICNLDNDNDNNNNNEEKFENFIKSCSNIGEKCKIDLINLFNKYLIKDYVNCMNKDRTYAGIYEIKAIADLYKKQIRVFEISNNKTQYKLKDNYLRLSAIVNSEISDIINLLYDSNVQHYEILLQQDKSLKQQDYENLFNRSPYEPVFKLSNKPIVPFDDSFILGDNIDTKLRKYCEFINS